MYFTMARCTFATHSKAAAGNTRRRDESPTHGGGSPDPGASRKGANRMSTITTKDGTQIYYKDWGSGQPVVFSHGWPLSADAWEDQMVLMAGRGYRCVPDD